MDVERDTHVLDATPAYGAVLPKFNPRSLNDNVENLKTVNYRIRVTPIVVHCRNFKLDRIS